MTNEQTTKMNDEEFFYNFVNTDIKKNSMKIAKQQDKIQKLESKINKFKAIKEQNKNVIEHCKTVMKSNAYPELNPLVSFIADRAGKSVENQDKKIAKAEKKIKKANNKINKISKKLKRTEFLKTFINSLKSSDNRQETFINGMRSMKEDSLLRFTEKQEKTQNRITSLREKLNSGTISNSDTLKIETKIKNLENRLEKIIAKINNLTELDQSLDKLAKIELAKEKMNEIVNSTVETAEKAALKGGSTDIALDDITQNSTEIIENVIEPKTQEVSEQKENVKEENPTEEKNDKTEVKKADNAVFKKLSNEIENDYITFGDITLETAEQIKAAGYKFENGKLFKDEPKKAEVPVKPENNLLKAHVTYPQAQDIIKSGVSLKGIKKDDNNKVCIVFNKNDAEKVHTALKQLSQSKNNKTR